MEKEIVKTAVFLHGLSEFKKGNAVAAIDIFDPLLDIEIGPTPANEYEITLLRGLCYRDLGETKDAIDDSFIFFIVASIAGELSAPLRIYPVETKTKTQYPSILQ